jgi:hypothetical protein
MNLMLEEILDEKYIVAEAEIGLTLHAAASGCIIPWGGVELPALRP